MQRKTPSGVRILAVVEFASGILALYGGLTISRDTGALALAGYTGGEALLSELGVLSVVLGIVSLVIGFGLWIGKRWAWLFGIVFGAVGIAVGIVVATESSVFIASAIIDIVIGLIVINYLLRGNVREFFRGGKATGPAPEGTISSTPTSS